MARIFLSYRRNDTAGHTGRMFDYLSRQFGEGRVFLDVEGIDPGQNFARAIEDRIKDCDTVVVVIGNDWAGRQPDGRRRLDDPEDYVRLEVETAFRFGIDVVPVLVAGAGIPARQDLPESLSELPLLNALEIDDRRFGVDMERLIAALEKTTARGLERRRLQKAERPRKQPAPAAGAERRSSTRRKVETLLLLYSPSHPATWIVHVLFYFGLLVLAVAPIMMASEGEPGAGLVIALAYLGILAVLRAIAAVVEPAVVPSAFRRWWLLYKAPRRGTTGLQILFFLMLLVVGFMPTAIIPMISEQESDLAKLAFVDTAVLVVVVTFVVREIAAARDPLRPAGTDRNWFARLLYVWSPRRAATWLPRLLWYAGALVLLIALPQVFADEHGNLHFGAITDNWGAFTHVALYLALAISARGWVWSLEQRARRSTSRRPAGQWLPLPLPSDARGWAPVLLFWLSVALAAGVVVGSAVVLPLLGLADANVYYIAGLAASIAVSAFAWSRAFERRPVSIDRAPSVGA